MLERIKSRLTYHMHAMFSSLNLLCRKPLASLMTVSVIAIALALPSLFWVFTDNIRHLTSNWKKSGHITLYLQTALAASEVEELLETIHDIDGVGQLALRSSQEGLDELSAQEGMQDIMEYLPGNPLPNVVELSPSLGFDSPAQLDLLARQLRTMPQIEHVKIDMEWIGRLHTFLSFAETFSDTLFALLATAVVLIIGNTLRLAIQNRQEEIKILKLVGATDPFIARPFLYSGIFYGLVGAFVAVFLVNIFILSLGMVVNQLTVIYQMHYPLSGLSPRQILLLVSFAIILGWIAAYLSVRKQLAAIEPVM